MKPATIKDVARAAGVSIWTVSNAFSAKAPVTEETRNRVFQAAKHLRYTPNQTARALRRETPGPIVVMTASTSNIYYVDMLDGIHETLLPSPYGVRTADLAPEGRFDQETENHVITEAIASRAAGMISTLTLSIGNHERICEWGIPIVYVDSKGPAGPSGSVSVTSDNKDAARQIGRHLSYHQLTDWVLLIYPERWSTKATRVAGMRDAAKKHESTLTVIECENTPQSSRKNLKEYLGQGGIGKLAVIAGNNPLLLGAMQALRDLNIDVPRQVALLAFDEFAWSAFVNPPITLVDESSKKIGSKAAAKLLSIMEEHPQGPIQYRSQDSEEVEIQLKIRASCGCATQ